MKKLMLVAGFAALSLVACNKKEDASSRIGNNVTAAEPTATNNTPATTQPNAAAGAPETTATTANETPQNGYPKIAFNKTTHDFGDLKKGSKGEFEFIIKNEGTVDLVVIDAKASCGCTVPEKPTAPIKPGKSDKMKVVFSANSPGLQSKNITLTTNTQAGSEMLTIKANVIE
ncbi:DUF1573 domain-containing protein [Myroides sp. JBRI-B21084]|uniref:DUF1573 domain-containing protein n=1 Tax=Myroides sp. JBRI-B21084 TaxID=3119977 RepID=UPI0026E4602E|nr:DUF1573 domain-containing protein [Paenimyroides cloacae]WKW47215.1 DUF1573 domain-containing protein [Paenimyroides cloacae]